MNSGDEEKEYWEKMRAGRDAAHKSNKRHQNQRGGGGGGDRRGFFVVSTQHLQFTI
jgi:hypothetical protein